MSIIVSDTGPLIALAKTNNTKNSAMQVTNAMIYLNSLGIKKWLWIDPY